MEPEIEATFPDIDKDEIRAALREVNAELIQPERLMRRRVYNPREKNADWFRVRDEGDRVTMSYKKMNKRTVDGMQEIMVEINDFELACQFLDKTGVYPVSYQETKRESWRLDGVEIEIDEWPWVPPFLEIEGKDEQSVRRIVERLGFKWDDAMFGSVENIYQRHYEVTEEEVNFWPKITFSPVPDWLKRKARF